MNLIMSEDSENVRVCRVCLIRDVKMYDLQSYPLESDFEYIIGVPVISTMDLPPFLCYECATLVKKFSSFRERCLTGQAALYGILQNFGKLTEKEINKIDRKKSQLTSRIANHTVSENTFYSEEGKILQEVKEEQMFYNDFEVTVDIKQEDVPSTVDNAEFPGTTSDDEPLSNQKLAKSNWTVVEPVEPKDKKKKEKKRGRKKKEVPEVEIKSDNEVDNHELLEGVIDQQEGAPDHVLQLEDIIDQHEEEEPEIDIKEEVDTEIEIEGPRKSSRLRSLVTVRRTKNTGGVKIDDFYLEDYVTVIRLTLEEQIEEIKQRATSDNYKNAAFRCNLCFKGFIDANAWKHHVGKHDLSAGDVECTVCKFRFPSRRALQKHAVNHEKKYACTSCDYVSKTTTQAKQHQRWHKGVTYTCEYCDEVSNKWTSYLSHVRMKHPSSFVCSVCGYSFVSQLGLNMHRVMMHKNVKEKENTEDTQTGQYCKECDVHFLTAEAYNRHRITSVNHREDKRTTCRVCGITIPDPEEMRIHHRREHAKKRPKNYGKKQPEHPWPTKCEQCPLEINSPREYWTHFRRSHPDKTYPIKRDHVCDICGKSFRGNAFLTYHKRTHAGERKYSCADCGKSFFNRTNLSMHMKTHSDSRPYPCDVCVKAFKCKGALDRHYRSHTGVKPYECEICGKGFGQSNSRKLHVRTVHLKQPAPYANRTRDRRKVNQETAFYPQTHQVSYRTYGREKPQTQGTENINE